MRVMRANSASILTVLEVFKHDPLCVDMRAIRLTSRVALQ